MPAEVKATGGVGINAPGGEPGQGGGVVVRSARRPTRHPAPLFYEKGKGPTLRTLQV
jgi:hypothetical protein